MSCYTRGRALRHLSCAKCYPLGFAPHLGIARCSGRQVKLRPRRWRRPPIEKGAVVETNCRMRWANWKQFYTNGAMPMLNMMGDGGPLVCKAWDEAIASMAMCEEATFVFGVKEVRLASPIGAQPCTALSEHAAGGLLHVLISHRAPHIQVQRMMMPFVAARRAPPGTILVIEVGLIDVRRDNGRYDAAPHTQHTAPSCGFGSTPRSLHARVCTHTHTCKHALAWACVRACTHTHLHLHLPTLTSSRREVDDYLWFKTKAEHRQMKLDRIEEQKLMRIRERRERDQRTDTVQRLLKASTEQRDAELDRQKDGEEAPTGPPTRTADAVPAVAAATVVEDEREVWEEAPDMDCLL